MSVIHSCACLQLPVDICIPSVRFTPHTQTLGYCGILPDNPNYKYTVLGDGVSAKAATPFGLALGFQVGVLGRDFPPKTHAKGHSHVTDAAACMLHYTAQAPSDMHARIEHDITSGNHMQGYTCDQQLRVRRPGSRQRLMC